MNNPFNPKEVRLSNYNHEGLQNKKVENITTNMYGVRNTSKTYQERFQNQKSIKDAVNMPKSYGDVFGKPKTYSDVLKKPDNYSDHMQRNGYNGFKNN